MDRQDSISAWSSLSAASLMSRSKLIGTTAETIFKAEDRQAFKDTMEKIGEPIALHRL
ncbi:MAG: hypothetical protein ACLRI8_03640 [Agathobacter rectalis]